MTTIPADTFKSVVKAKIVSDRTYRPSLGTQLQHAIEEVPATLRQWIESIENNPDLVSSQDFQNIDRGGQAKILSAANDLLTYRSRRTSRSADTAQRRLSLLKHISKIENYQKPQINEPLAPESAHETLLLSLGVGRENKQRFNEATFRISYHDILDRQAGYLRGAGISLGESSVRRNENEDSRVQAFELVQLQSISDRSSHSGSLSWELQFGLARDPLIASDRLTARLRGAAGKSLPLSQQTVAYALAGPSLNLHGSDFESSINFHANAGLLWYWNRATHQLEVAVDSMQDQSLRTRLSLSRNFNLTTNQAIRLMAWRDRVDQTTSDFLSLAYRYYF